MDGQGKLYIDGTIFHADVREIGNGAFSVVAGGRSFRFVVKRIAGGYRVLLKCREHDARVESERDLLLRRFSRSLEGERHHADVRAPMPALIVRVEVKEGDSVRPGQGLIVLEAMKMENELKAVQGGIVRQVTVREGQSVERGAFLLRID